MGRSVLARRSVRRARAVAQSGIYAGRGHVAGARHHGHNRDLQRPPGGRPRSISLQGRGPSHERACVERSAARLPDRIFGRSVRRNRRAEHDLRWNHRLDDQRRAVDGRRRPAAIAREPRHVQYLRGDGRSAAHWKDTDGGGRPPWRRAGRRARLSVLAAPVRRRCQRARPPASAQRHDAYGHRRDAEAFHVARRGRVSAHPARARKDH